MTLNTYSTSANNYDIACTKAGNVHTPVVSVGNLPITAFGDMRTAELSPMLQYSFEYTVDNTDLMTNTVVNGGTVTQADGMGIVGTSTTTGSVALMQSKRHANYRAGLGGLARFTTLFTAGVAGTQQYAGLGDEQGSSTAVNNGYLVGFNGTTFGFQRFSNDAQTTVAQADWIDPLDGTGASGMILDHTKLNVWEIRYQYLGAGQILLCIEDPETGLFVVAHAVKYANQNTVPSTYNPHFHLGLFVDNGATTSDIVLKTASMAYFIEGKQKLIQLHQPQFPTGIREKTSVTTETAIFTIRNDSTYAGKKNFIDALLERMVCSIDTNSANNLGVFRLVRNATLGGTPSYTDINTTNSIMSIDVAGTTVTGGETLLVTPLAGKNDKFIEDITPYTFLIAPEDTITLAATSANSAAVDGALVWKELF